MRKLVAMTLFLVWLLGYIVAVATFSGAITALPRWAQRIVYVIAGIAWIIPLRPLFRLMNSGPRPDM